MAAAAGGAPAGADRATVDVDIRGDAALGLDDTLRGLPVTMTISELKERLERDGVGLPRLQMVLYALDVAAHDRGALGYDSSAPLFSKATLGAALAGERGIYVKVKGKL